MASASTHQIYQLATTYNRLQLYIRATLKDNIRLSTSVLQTLVNCDLISFLYQQFASAASLYT